MYGILVTFWHMRQEVARSGHPDVQELHMYRHTAGLPEVET